jgi:trehalose synthase
MLDEAQIIPLTADRFARVLPATAYRRFADALRRGAHVMQGRTMWHVNTALKGGGVAEMLSSMLPYAVGAGIECRWVVVAGDEDFLAVTKRLHNALHGFKGDGGDLGIAEAEHYAATLARNAEVLVPHVRPGDVVFVHDPQTAGLIPALTDAGAVVVWHCHIGADEPNDTVRQAWQFLLDEVEPARRHIFSRREYLWDGLDPDRLRVIQPSIDAFSPKNQALDERNVDAILRAVGLIEGAPEVMPTFTRRDGDTNVVKHPLVLVDGGGPLPAAVPVVMQSARWDRLKDPTGVIDFFAEHLGDADAGPHLVLAGPSVEGVGDDPEGRDVLAECVERRRALPARLRERVHLVCSPMEDEEETEAVVNAMQRRADVVVQKSLAEGFGLVVAEAMWKRRAVVSARVGGIQDQIEHGRSGILVDDPGDGAGFARAVADLLARPDRAREIGDRAQARVLDRFLTPRQLTETLDLTVELLA